jgi:hypothetical protein
MDIVNLFVIFLDRSQSAVEVARLPEHSRFLAAGVDAIRGTHFDTLQGTRNRQRKGREENGMPVIGQEHPGCQQKAVLGPALRTTRATTTPIQSRLKIPGCSPWVLSITRLTSRRARSRRAATTEPWCRYPSFPRKA